MAAGFCLWLGIGDVSAAAMVDLTEQAVTSRHLARHALLESLKRTDTAYRFEFVVVYLPKGTIEGDQLRLPGHAYPLRQRAVLRLRPRRPPPRRRSHHQ